LKPPRKEQGRSGARQLAEPGIDLTLKLDNVNNTRWWDAGQDVLFPRRRFQGTLWHGAAR